MVFYSVSKAPPGELLNRTQRLIGEKENHVMCSKIKRSRFEHYSRRMSTEIFIYHLVKKLADKNALFESCLNFTLHLTGKKGCDNQGIRSNMKTPQRFWQWA